MANVIELLTRLSGVPEVQRGLQDLTRSLGSTGRAANDAAPAMGRLSGAMGAVAAAAAGLITARAAITFIRDADAAAREAERSTRAAAASLGTLGIAYQNVRAEVEATTSHLEDLTGIADDDLTRALGALVRITRDYEGSLRLLATVADVAAGREMDLAAAAELVGRAAVGETSQLRRLIPTLREGATAAEAIAEIQRSFAGQAVAAADATTRLGTAWDRFQETVGTRVRPALDALYTLLTKLLEVSEKLAATAIFDLEPSRLRPRDRDRMTPGQRAADDLLLELDREARRGVVGGRLAEQHAPRFEPVDEEAFRRAQLRDKLLREEEEILQKGIEARIDAEHDAAARLDAILTDEAKRFEAHQEQQAEDAFAVHQYRMRLLDDEERAVAEFITKQRLETQERLFGFTEKTMIQLADVGRTLWQDFQMGAGQAFAAVLVDGADFAQSLKNLFRRMAADLVSLLVQSGLQKLLFGVTGGTVGAGPGAGPASGVAAGAAGGALGFGPAAVLAGAAMFATSPSVQNQLRGSWDARRIGMAVATFGFSEQVPAVLDFVGLGSLTTGAGKRAEKRRGGQVAQRVAELEALGIDRATAEAIVGQQEATRGRFGTGGAFFELGHLIDTARAAGLSGETAGRGLGFVTNFEANRAAAQETLSGITGGLAGFGPQAAEVTAILEQGAGATLEAWEEVDTFFQRFTETLARVQQTLEGGFTDAFAKAAASVLRGGGALDALREGIRSTIESAIIEGFVGGVIVQDLIGPYIERFRDAVLTGSEDPRAVMADLAAQIPAWAALVESIFGPIQPYLDQIYTPPRSGTPLGVQVVPAMAEGGIVTAPTLALIGERGPEAVLPLSQLPLRIEIPIYLDRREIARAAYEGIPFLARTGAHAGR